VTRAWPLLLCLFAACPKSGDKVKPVEPIGSGSAPTVPPVVLTGDAGMTLPPAPPLPAVPASLPPLAPDPRVTAEAVALGELLFFDPRLSDGGDRSCATCHVPDRGFSGDVLPALDGKPNARRAPTLVNLAWVTAFGWDGRAASLAQFLPGHIAGQLGAPYARIAAVPVYAAHLARIGGAATDVLVQALEAYSLTRYEGDTPWDNQERQLRTHTGNPLVAGYQLFTGKAQCAQCHPPPLYTDNQYHRVIADTVGDIGRGRVEADKTGAFRTPTLRGVQVRGAYFHHADMKSVDEVIAYYQSPAAATQDPTFGRIRLTADEARQLAMFLNMLTINRPPVQKPVLP
jgi:cytochrome c peroxidase